VENREFDVIVWGATGFTGQLVVEYMASKYGADSDLKWAVAGRNAKKLANVVSKRAGGFAADIPQLIANSDDPDSIRALVARTKVICAVVGPYALYGEAVVAACAEQGTHYCDLTGEVQWMRKMIDSYQSQSEASGATIVHTCGFDSIPSDMGVFYLQKKMQEAHGCHASTVKFRVGDTSGGVSGGTVASMMNMMEEGKVDPSILDLIADPYALNPQNMPRGEDGPDQSAAIYDADFKQWTAPFVMAAINTRVVRRSNALMDYKYGSEFRYSESMLMGNGPGGYMKASLVAGMSGLLMLLTAFKPTRSLLAPLMPSPGEGPSEEAIEKGYFKIEFFGEASDDAAKKLSVTVSGDRDPGYGATSKMLAESAVCLAKDSLDVAGGIWTPSTAMGEQLLDRLENNAGMSFTVSD
jgi:short subunit dehydrogenase-like uncharacterized protein